MKFASELQYTDSSFSSDSLIVTMPILSFLDIDDDKTSNPLNDHFIKRIAFSRKQSASWDKGVLTIK